MQRAIKLLAMTGVFFALALAIQQGWLDVISTSERAMQTVKQAGLKGYGMVLLSGTLFMAIGGPRQLIALVLGFILGTGWGFLAAILVSGLSLAVTYFTAHMFLQPLISKRFKTQSERLVNWINVATTRLMIL